MLIKKNILNKKKNKTKMMIKEINNAFNNSGNKLLLIIWFSYWNITGFWILEDLDDVYNLSNEPAKG